jgi:CDP-diglyceride synthetase
MIFKRALPLGFLLCLGVFIKDSSKYNFGNMLGRKNAINVMAIHLGFADAISSYVRKNCKNL